MKKKLHRGDRLIGTIISIPSPEISEIYANSGFDWLFIDLEHSALSVRDAQLIIQSISMRTECVIRVPSNDEIWIKKALDIGASGIIIPQIKTAEEAKKAIRFCKYPPQGIRSVGIARAQGYGKKFQEYVDNANDDIAVIIQIEHIDAVRNIEEIIQVKGIDCLFLGPYDLSASMGKVGLTTDAEVQKAIKHVKKNAETANIPMGIFGPTADAVQSYVQTGYTLIAVGIDTMLIQKMAKEIVENWKNID